MAAAPGHPFLAKVIELVVNNARNRFTSVEYDNMFCPSPEFSILHAHDALFTAGPCILGVAVNEALGRPGQARIDEGELRPPVHANVTIPGRTIIMSTSKEDVSRNESVPVTAWYNYFVLTLRDHSSDIVGCSTLYTLGQEYDCGWYRFS